MPPAPPSGDAPRPSLNREVILDAFLTLAARPGTTGVSFRSLGQELGADPTAVYRHFRDKSALIEAALDRLIGEAAAAASDEPDWRERISRTAAAYLDLMVRHPVVGQQAGHRTTGGPGELAMLELLLQALVDAGLPDDLVVDHYALIAAFAASMAASQAAYLIDDARIEARAERPWVGTYPVVDPQQHPQTVRLQARLAKLRDAEVFDTGLTRLLDAVEQSAGTTRG